MPGQPESKILSQINKQVNKSNEERKVGEKKRKALNGPLMRGKKHLMRKPIKPRSVLD